MRVALLVLLLSLAGFACAKEATPLAADPAVEKRLDSIAEELRCLVCQNESLAASRADLAADLRREIREMIKAGRSDKEIKDYLVARYGDFVLYRPPLKTTTILLWFGPFLLLIGGVAVLLAYLRRRKSLVVDAPLSPEESEHFAALLQTDASPVIEAEKTTPSGSQGRAKKRNNRPS